MGMIRNILAIIGLLVIVGAAVAYPKVNKYVARFGEFDPEAMGVYMNMFEQIIETGNPAEATVWKRQVKEGLSYDDVEQTMLTVANELNFKSTGKAPFYKEIEAMTGKPFRKVGFYFFCDAMVGADMLAFNDAYSAYMPCRIAIVEDKTGRLWLMTLNMDLMIHGGLQLPPKLKEDALRVKKTMLTIMERAASGEF